MEGMQILKKQRIGEPGVNFNPSIEFKPEFSSDPFAGKEKTRACTKFFSVSGCPYWSGCNFLHSLPPGTASIPTMISSSFENEGKRKTKLCNKFSSPEGCPFGDKCHFAHGDNELQAASLQMRTVPQRAPSGMQFMPGQNFAPPAPAVGVSVATATANMEIRADAVGVVIGKGGCNIKQTMHHSGARVRVINQEEDEAKKLPTRTVEMTGTLEQIQVAQHLVQQYVNLFTQQVIGASSGVNNGVNNITISSLSGGMGGGMGGSVTGFMPTVGGGGMIVSQPQYSQFNPAGGFLPILKKKPVAALYKTKMCDNRNKPGGCPFKDKCNFAHDESELQEVGAQIQAIR